MGDLLFLLFLLGITYMTGSMIEKKHFDKIKQRERNLVTLPTVTLGSKKWAPSVRVKKMEMVTGEVVISGDYFKNFIAGIKNIFGGRMTSMESVMDRARREATLKMREKAIGASVIVNTRYESVMLNHVHRSNSIPKCAVIAYGTAVTFE